MFPGRLCPFFFEFHKRIKINMVLVDDGSRRQGFDVAGQDAAPVQIFHRPVMGIVRAEIPDPGEAVPGDPEIKGRRASGTGLNRKKMNIKRVDRQKRVLGPEPSPSPKDVTKRPFFFSDNSGLSKAAFSEQWRRPAWCPHTSPFAPVFAPGIGETKVYAEQPEGAPLVQRDGIRAVSAVPPFSVRNAAGRAPARPRPEA
jgi:hypothetical protein